MCLEVLKIYLQLAACKEYGLQRLDLNNMIKFGTHTIPSWLGELQNLKVHLKGNALYGPIPFSFGNLWSNLEDLDISYNMLTGGIGSITKLSNLLYLDLRNNNLDGVIPESFGQLQNLKVFDFSNNPLKCVITEIHFANLTRLKSVIMSGNEHLSFEIKHDWVPPFQLHFFSVRSTKSFGLTGFPPWLLTQKKELILYLDLSNTRISGPLPTWLSFPNFISLDISNNQISGPLPKSIGYQNPNMFAFYISNMYISGTLPSSICQWKNLTHLGLSNNELSGTIPSCLLTPNLKVFYLSSNKFSGFFPSNSLNNLSSLEVIHLANNKLEGEPLIAMSSCTSLSILDLEGNYLFGSIPSWMGTSLQSLQILNLQGNSFNGTIPLSLWLLPRLQILILADNKLEGNIQVMKSNNLSYSYLQLYSMVNIDLSNNNLYGHIPRELFAIYGLFALNLSHNYLSRTIPMQIGRSIALKSLDLSSNQLSGSIPISMASLSLLGTLNLSNNNFSERIPREGHLSTFNDASSYEGNPYLCGDPLFIKCPNENRGEPSIEMDNFHDNDGQDEEDKLEIMWFCIIVMLGYAFGFWGVVGPLILKRSWRRAYFRFMYETKDKIYVAILMNIRRLKQRMGGNNRHQSNL